MSGAMIGLFVFLAMTALILIGVPVAISMLSCSLVGMLLVSTPSMAISQFTNSIFSQSTSYMFAVVPLFMIVGNLAGDTGMAEGAFVAAKKWVGRQRGGLLSTVVIANMIFGACSGVSSAGNIVFGKIALPQLDKENYNRRLSLGTITASGTLSVLIPPSIPILTFALLVDVSVGQALVAGISTGIIFAILMLITLQVIIKLDPSKVPPRTEEKIPMMEKLKTLNLLLPILVLFGLIVGGSFFGWFPATVGGAVACVAIFIYAAFKKMPLKEVLNSVWNGVRGFAGIYLIIVAGKFFSRFITMTGLTSTIITTVSNLNMAPFAVFLIVLVFYLFCGCFLDMLSIVIITAPIIFPVLTTGLGYNELVMVIVLVFVMEMATLTPPIGMAVFTVSNALNISTSEIFKGVIPFFFVDLVITLLIVLVPDLILWLPRLMGY